MLARLRRPVFAGLFAALALAIVLPSAPADGPADNLPDNVRPVPPKGVTVPDADRAELVTGLTNLKAEVDALKSNPLSVDVEIYEKAVRYAVQYNEFFNVKEIGSAKKLLQTGLQRAKELKDGKPSWTTATGYVVRGYRSKIDGSAQPYGLHVPAGYNYKGDSKHRLDFWWHGRGETLSEVNFIANQQNAGGVIPAPGAFILLPYGRYCNANKLAGEVDTFECLAHAQRHYRIDDSRLVARGFSMGGAACWQYAVHYPTLWAAAAPGAGFSETPEVLNVFQSEKVEPTWYEKNLWGMYNATDYAQNIYNIPTVAYSGEIDKQKQAADVMAREMKKVGLELVHIIGPKTAHSYEKAAKEEVNKLIDAIVAKGKPEYPTEIKFVTHTLRYNWCAWVSVNGLTKHWNKATVNGTMTADKDGRRTVKLTTDGVSSLIVRAPKGPAARVTIDGQFVSASFPTGQDQILGFERTAKTGGKWAAMSGDPEGLAKIPGLQGPIDDAFLDRFIMVSPSGKPLNDKIGAWSAAEMKHAVRHWRQQFRGDAIVKDDSVISEDDIKNANLILWGDPQSNAILAKIADKLPVKWTASGVVVGDKTYDAATHVPILIFPNPLNPSKYVVLNSGFTFREYDYLNNARQVPKLPDYAVVDVTTPPNSRYPGKVVRAGFFGEKWELLPNDGQ